MDFHSFSCKEQKPQLAVVSKGRGYFFLITRDLEVSSPELVPLMWDVQGQGPRYFHSLCNVLFSLCFVICGHRMVAATLSSQEEWEREGLHGAPITPSSADGNLDTSGGLSPKWLSLLVFFFCLFFYFSCVDLCSTCSVVLYYDVSLGSNFISLKGGSFLSTTF